jgi:hypothetical protein
MAAARKLADFHGGTSYAVCVQSCSRMRSGDVTERFVDLLVERLVG